MSETSARALWPGLAIAVGLALGGFLLATVPWVKETLRFSPLLIVVLLGIAVASVVRLPAVTKPGIQLAQKPVLRWAVAGLGFRLSLPELAAIGVPSLVVVVVATIVGVAGGWWLAVRLGLNERLGMLLGAGGGICGASAVVAADSVVQADDKDAALSLGVITLWGTVGIFLYPVIARAAGLGEFVYGVWCGASLHETAQVVAAASGLGPGAEETATVVKLARICLLAPIVFFFAWWLSRRGDKAGEAKVSPIPWFLVMFVVFAGINSLGVIPKEASTVINQAVVLLLCVGMAGVGLQTGLRDLASAGWRPVLVGLVQWIMIAAVSLGLALGLGL